MLRMSEAQVFVALPTLMSDPTERNFPTSLGVTSRQGGVTCWPEAVHKLVHTCATPGAMREAMDNL